MTIATAKSVFATNRDALPQVKVQGGEMGNKVRRAYAKYVLLGTEAATCVIEMLKLPKGAIVLPISSIYTQDLGTDVNGTIGDGTTADKFLTTTSLVTAARTNFTGMPVELSAETTLYVTFADAGSFAVVGGQYFEIEVYYTTPN